MTRLLQLKASEMLCHLHYHYAGANRAADCNGERVFAKSRSSPRLQFVSYENNPAVGEEVAGILVAEQLSNSCNELLIEDEV